MSKIENMSMTVLARVRGGGAAGRSGRLAGAGLLNGAMASENWPVLKESGTSMTQFHSYVFI